MGFFKSKKKIETEIDIEEKRGRKEIFCNECIFYDNSSLGYCKNSDLYYMISKSPIVKGMERRFEVFNKNNDCKGFKLDEIKPSNYLVKMDGVNNKAKTKIDKETEELRERNEIYCKECKYCVNGCPPFFRYSCTNSKVWIPTNKTPIKQLWTQECLKINKNNDCKGFEKKSA